MAIDYKKVGISGLYAGAITPFLLQWVIVPILNFFGTFVPQVSLKLAEASSNTLIVNIRESLTGFEAIGGWLTDALGITSGNGLFMTVALGAAGGAVVFIAGAWLAESFGFLTGNAMQKTRNTIFAGSIIAGLVLGIIGLPPELGITLMNVLIAMLVNAAILAWLYTWVAKNTKLDVVPF